jgi:hypothetical protein
MRSSEWQLAGSREANLKASGTRLDIEENEREMKYCKTISLPRHFTQLSNYCEVLCAVWVVRDRKSITGNDKLSVVSGLFPVNIRKSEKIWRSNFFFFEILKRREIFIFSGTDGKGSPKRENLIPAGKITCLWL